VPREDFDQQLDWLATEVSMRQFGQGS